MFSGLLLQVLTAVAFISIAGIASVVVAERNGTMVVSKDTQYSTQNLQHMIATERLAAVATSQLKRRQRTLVDEQKNELAALQNTHGDNVGAARDALHAIFLEQQQLIWETKGAEHADAVARDDVKTARQTLAGVLQEEAVRLQHARGGSVNAWRQALEKHIADPDSKGFVSSRFAQANSRALEYRVLALLLMCWWLSLVLQGEGVNFDSMRRRHPMWEWYLAYPVPQSVVFTAEALAPAVSNPLLLMSPVMLVVLVGALSKSLLAGVCALPIAIPLLIAATLWAKALEVLIMLRSSARNRSAWFAVLAAVGFGTLFMPLILLQSPALAYRLASIAAPMTDSLPSAQWILDAGNLTGWLRAMGLSTLIGLFLALPAFFFMRFAAARGLESGFGSANALSDTGSFELRQPGRWGWLRDPLLRKERLWLKRDRGALVQLIGVPLVLMSAQFFNLNNMLRSVDLTWNKLAGIVVYFGGYLLSVAGPRALLSEGPALMLTLSWPRSLEDTLRMKVRLLLVLVYTMVCACLGIVIWMFPGNAFELLAVALIWPLFGMSVAEKAVTLIRAPSQSGEPEPVPRNQVWAASLGNATFAIGIFTAQWQLAIAAIAMNWVFAGALWQSFRIRLAYLFDPESEPQLRPPTILSSVIAIVGLLEFGAIFSIPFLLALGKDAAPFAHAMGYGFAAIGVCMAVVSWQNGRGVRFSEMLTLGVEARFVQVRGCFAALVGGTVLAILAIGYQQLLLHAPWPELHDYIERSTQFFADSPNARVAYAIMAIGIAPWVEEFLFRGLMFRAMLPQWGLARATLASAAFFTVLHPWPAWPMVFLLGISNALLYARSRSLLPCILLHASYNAALIYFSS